MNNDALPSFDARRKFLGKLGLAAATSAGAAVGGAVGAFAPAAARAAASGSFPTKDYDWTKRRWGFGVDVNKCIGCLPCVEACKAENQERPSSP